MYWHNDYSERAFQIEKEGQWCKGKGCDTFAPIGPFIATKDEIDDPNNLNLWLKLNGETVQNSSTDDFIFNVQEVVSYISQFMTLLPGDIISTGTPFGVGLGFDPPKYMKPGDVVELGIEGSRNIQTDRKGVSIVDLNLKDKVIVVTGGSKGIGNGICTILAAEGAIPVIIGRNRDNVMDAVKKIEDGGHQAYYAFAELTDPEQCRLAVERTVEKFGRIEGLVNNAGVNDGVGTRKWKL